MSGNTPKRYLAELKQREVRMYAEVRTDHDTHWAAMARVGELLGIATAPVNELMTLDAGGYGSTHVDPVGHQARLALTRASRDASPKRSLTVLIARSLWRRYAEGSAQRESISAPARFASV